jgi:N-acetyl-anhydromuramoyl-L-alanine amidase
MPPENEKPSAPWHGGWHGRARQLASPNFGPRPAGACIDLIVVHSISLPPGIYGGNEVQRLFTNTLDWDAHPYFATIRGVEVSAHFFIRRDGVLWQFVDCDARAWHAGRSRYRGKDNCNDDSVELEGLEGSTFEPAQYRALAALCDDLAERYPIAHIAGHEHIAPGRKQDPGIGFDWRLLRAAMHHSGLHFPDGTG